LHQIVVFQNDGVGSGLHPEALVQHDSGASDEWLASDVVGFFDVANRFSIDLRAERDAFIADENATLR
jgi:hypothetical protein